LFPPLRGPLNGVVSNVIVVTAGNNFEKATPDEQSTHAASIGKGM